MTICFPPKLFFSHNNLNNIKYKYSNIDIDIDIDSYINK